MRCGLRFGELAGLRREDIDLVRCELRVAKQVQQRKRKKTKSDSGKRTLPISPDLIEVLKRHLRNQEEERSISPAGWNQVGYVFCTEYGTPFNPANIWRQFNALQRRAGLSEPCALCAGQVRGNTEEHCAACDGHGVISSFRFHDMRHTYAALSLAAKVDIFIVSRRMGHSSITVTSDRYGHLYSGEAHDADAIERLIKKGIEG